MMRKFRVLARTGIVAAAVALPMAFAAPAQAASEATWDALAQCESSGNWAANTGNGYFGGLQFTDSTWKSFGGAAFAPRADQATRGQQIQIAERVLAGQGWGAWPTCSKKIGAA